MEENETYRHRINQLENQIQTHLSDRQKLKSQIQSMQSTLDAIAQENQNLNAHIARLAESDLVLVENEKLKKENQKRNIPKAAEGTYGAWPAPWRTLGIFLYNFLIL